MIKVRLDSLQSTYGDEVMWGPWWAGRHPVVWKKGVHLVYSPIFDL